MSGYNSSTATITNVIYRAPLTNPVNGWANTGSTLPGGNYYASTAIIGNAAYIFGGASSSVIWSAPIFNGSPNISSNPSWKTATNVSGSGGGVATGNANTSTELAYATIPGSVSNTATATWQNVVTLPAITVDGNTAIYAQIVSGLIEPCTNAANASIMVGLFEGSTQIDGNFSTFHNEDAAGNYGGYMSFNAMWPKFTPSAGSHTYTIKLLSNVCNGALISGGGYSTAYARIFLANPLLQGGNGGIQNGTTTQTANINIQSVSASSPTAVIQGASSQSANILEVKNGTGTIVFNVDPSGNIAVAGNLSVTGNVTVNGYIATPSSSMYGTSLPGSPVNGQEFYYVADATNGVVWHLRYNSASASSYKWEYLGGAPLKVERVAGLSNTGINVWGTGLVDLTIPRNGDYEYTYNVGVISNGSAGTATGNLSAQASTTTPNTAVDGYASSSMVNGGNGAAVYSKRLTGMTAGTVWRAYNLNNQQPFSYYSSSASLIPIRIN
jgi:hypothetical protein